LYTGGLKIHTTLDLDMQRYAEEAISNTLTEPQDPQAALVSMTPSGALRAFVGGTDYTSVKKARGFNYASSLPGRQAG
ncbi:MAG: penicillin-binding protein, partial [Actinomycetota bacterium]|nr:penicillin-binding protein [Actinomycetota bacterium]